MKGWYNMNKKQQYKQQLERHDDPRYTFEHYNGYSFYPSYGMDTNDLRDLRKEYRNDLHDNNGYKITDRAIVIAHNHGTMLKSYYTIVCAIVDGVFYKTWEGFSSTTMKHINTYRLHNNLPALSKHDWVMMPTTTEVINDETGEVIWYI